MRSGTMKTAIAAYIETTRLAWSRRRTERLIGRMPEDIRKDIGWPDITRNACARQR